MNKKNMVMVVFVCGIVAFAVAAFAVWLYQNFEFSQQDYYYEGCDAYSVGNVNLDATSVSSIEIDWLHGNVNIVSYDGTEIQITEENAPAKEQNKLHYHLNNNGYLQIKYFSSRQNAGIYSKVENKTLTIKVPNSINIEELQIYVVTGDTKIEGISVEDKLYITSVTGRVSLQRCMINKLFCDITTGNFYDNNSTIGQVHVGIVTGSMIMEGVYSNITGGITTGHVGLTPRKCNKIKLSVDTGDMVIDFEQKGQFTARYLVETGNIDFGLYEVKNMGTSYVIHGQGTTEMVLSVKSGNIQFK